MEKKEISKASILRKLALYHKPYKFRLLLALCLVICSNLLLLIAPLLSGMAIDVIGTLHEGGNIEEIYSIAGILALIYTISACLVFTISKIMVHVGKGITGKIRDDMQEHMLNLKISYFDTKQTGEVISNFSYDVGVLNTALTNDLLQIANSTATFVFSVTMMYWISPKLLLVFCITIVNTIFFARYRLKKTKPLFQIRSKKLGEMNGRTEEILSGIKTIIAYNQQEKMKERYEEVNVAATKSYFTADYQASIMMTLMGLISNITLVLVGLIGSSFFMAGTLSVGSLSAFILYSRKCTGPINELAGIAGEIQSALSAGRRIFTLLEEEPEPLDEESTISLNGCQGEVNISHVDFGYVANQIVLKDMNFSTKTGETVAIVGHTGAGKSTIINLLMRFYDYQGGEILIDGTPINKIKREELRRLFTMVLQDTWIFQGSIFENIAYIHKDATLEEVKEVAKDARISQFIETLPEGYDTIIADEGSNLSKGQKQLISIARAMLVKAPMLILDEATSNIDSATEILVQEAMSNLMKNKTCFVIAHRLSTIKNADKILVIGDGKIQEQGTHKELLAQEGHYYTMYQAQFL